MEYNLPSEIVKDLTFGDQAKSKIIKGINSVNLLKGVKDRGLGIAELATSNDKALQLIKSSISFTLLSVIFFFKKEI